MAPVIASPSGRPAVRLAGRQLDLRRGSDAAERVVDNVVDANAPATPTLVSPAPDCATAPNRSPCAIRRY